MNECKYCANEELFILSKSHNGYELTIDVESEELIIWSPDDFAAAMAIKYCPMCGRKLSKVNQKESTSKSHQYNSMDFHNYLDTVFTQVKQNVQNKEN